MNEPIPEPWPTIAGTNTTLMGETGSGKTHAIRTLAEAGIEVFIIFTEPLGMEILGDTDPEMVHWHYVPPAKPTWDAMIDNATKINKMSYEDLAKIKSGMNKSEYAQFMVVLQQLNNFHDQRTGKDYGDVTTWDNRRAIVVDSLSGLSIMAMDLVVGAKPTKAMGDWGVAMDNLERLVTKLCADTNCFFVLTAHLEREVDEVTGSVKLMMSTLGRKLAPKLPRFFSDVVHCKRIEATFTWSTVTGNVDLKARNLPYSDNLPPSFVPLVENWKNKNPAYQPPPSPDSAGTLDGTAPGS